MASLVQLSEHFNLDEARCKDANRTPLPDGMTMAAVRLAVQLEVIRASLGGKPIEVVSWYRTPAHNKAVGGAKKSMHLTGKAVDIRIAGVKPSGVADVIEKLIREGRILPGGVGRYKTFTHYDVRGVNVRWSGSGAKDS